MRGQMTEITKPASVRLADHRDEEAIYDLLIAMHRYNQAGWSYPYRPEIVLSRIETGTRPDPRTRTNPQDQRRAIIGVIGPEGGPLKASIGLVIESPMWFSETPAMIELWFFVREGERRSSGHVKALREFALWAHASMKRDLGDRYPQPFELITGFQHRGDRFDAMLRLWRRWGGKMCGALFVVR